MHHSGSPSTNPPQVVAQAATTTQNVSERLNGQRVGELSSSSTDRVASYALHRPILPIAAVLEPVRRPTSSSKVDPSEQKKAALSAAYYTECYVRGIDPLEADKAATRVKDQYGKWWPSTKNSSTHVSAPSNNALHDKDLPISKRPRIDPPLQRQKRSVSNASGHGKALDSNSIIIDNSAGSNYMESTNKRKRQPKLSLSNNMEQSEMDVSSIPQSLNLSSAESLRMVKASLIQELRDNGGDTTTARFTSLLDVLHSWYNDQGYDARWSYEDPSCFMDGSWLTLSRPTYEDCLGQNQNGDLMYTLGRLAFDMFRPTGYRCSLQAIFQEIGRDMDGPFCDRPRAFPRRLLQERQARKHKPAMRTNDLVISFTIEPHQNRRGQCTINSSSSSSLTLNAKEADYTVQRPIRAILRNHGYCLPDPTTPNRLSVWFCGGKLEPAVDSDRDVHSHDEGTCSSKEWKQAFDETLAPSRSFSEMARILAARIFLGANLPQEMNSEDGSMMYSLQRPIGGHGSVYVDVLYCDETLRIIQGHHGSIFVGFRPLSLDSMTDQD